MSIQKRTLGRTGLEVTQLGYGAMELRGHHKENARPCTEDQARTILNAVVDSGINFIDTSNDYGASELFIGRCIADRRKDYYLATKCGCHVKYAGRYDENRHIWTRDNLLRNMADSLLKMSTDHVDLLQLHGPGVECCERAKLVDVLLEIKSKGGTRFIGCSSISPHLETYISWGVFDVFQIPYSALDRRHENLISKAAKSGAGILIRGGVAQGEGGTRGKEEIWDVFQKADLDELREAGESRTAFLLRFTLSHPDCHTTIVGTKNPEHLQENLKVTAKGPLPSDVYEEAKKRLDAAGERPLE